MLKREEILAKVTLKTEKILVEEWGGDVLISEMSGFSRDSWEQAISEKDGSGRLVSPRSKLVLFTVVDEAGNRIFKDDDIQAIGKLSAAALEKVCAVSMRLNALDAGAVAESKKN